MWLLSSFMNWSSNTPIREIATPKAGFFPLFSSIRAAILFKFTAIAVSLACMDMLRRPQPLARTNP